MSATVLGNGYTCKRKWSFPQSCKPMHVRTLARQCALGTHTHADAQRHLGANGQNAAHSFHLIEPRVQAQGVEWRSHSLTV